MAAAEEEEAEAVVVSGAEREFAWGKVELGLVFILRAFVQNFGAGGLEREQ